MAFQSEIIKALKTAMDELGIGFYTATSRNFVRTWASGNQMSADDGPAPPYPGEYVTGQRASQQPLQPPSTVPGSNRVSQYISSSRLPRDEAVGTDQNQAAMMAAAAAMSTLNNATARV